MESLLPNLKEEGYPATSPTRTELEETVLCETGRTQKPETVRIQSRAVPGGVGSTGTEDGLAPGAGRRGWECVSNGDRVPVWEVLDAMVVMAVRYWKCP